MSAITPEENIKALALVGMSTVEVVFALFETVRGLAQLLGETIIVAELPDAFTQQKIGELNQLLTEAGLAFAAAELVLPE